MKMKLTKLLNLFSLLFLLSLLLQTTGCLAVSQQDILNFSLAKPNGLGKKLILWGTQYYLYDFPYSKTNQYPLLDMNGSPLGPTLNEVSFCNAAMEGSVRFIEEQTTQEPIAKSELTAFNNGLFISQTCKRTIYRVYNYAGKATTEQVNCKKYFPTSPATGNVRFKESVGPFGEGTNGYMIIPYISIAVDPEIIPYGTLIYIPKTRDLKVKMPSGKEFKLTGYFFSSDRGGLIQKNHIDFYIGPYHKSVLDPIATADEADTFTAYVIDNDKALTDTFKLLHTPGSSILSPDSF